MIKTSDSIFKLEASVQHYDWGGFSFIPELVGISNGDHKPFAELWVGTHHRGVAQVIAKGEKLPLDELIASDGAHFLGEKIVSDFNGRLPYLFKVLDVNKMLSIQSHPTKKQAEIGFAKESEKGIPLTASHRNFKDDNHKPEVMVALTDFYLLHGFRPVVEIERLLQEIPELHLLQDYFVDKNIMHLYKAIMQLPIEEVNAILEPLKNRLLTNGHMLADKSHPDFWAANAFRDMAPGADMDRGVFSIYLLNLVQLKAGDGIFQAAGIPHAYLEGVNIELMANSDNVFRGGLTRKHVDFDALMNHLVFDEIHPVIISGKQISPVETIYPTPAPDFELRQVCFSKENKAHFFESQSPESFIVLDGNILLRSDEETARFSKGDVFFVCANTHYEMVAEGDAQIFKAVVP